MISGDVLPYKHLNCLAFIYIYIPLGFSSTVSPSISPEVMGLLNLFIKEKIILTAITKAIFYTASATAKELFIGITA